MGFEEVVALLAAHDERRSGLSRAEYGDEADNDRQHSDSAHQNRPLPHGWLASGHRDRRQFLGNSNDFGIFPCRLGILLNGLRAHKPIHGTAIGITVHDRALRLSRDIATTMRQAGRFGTEAALEIIATASRSLYTVAAARP